MGKATIYDVPATPLPVQLLPVSWEKQQKMAQVFGWLAPAWDTPGKLLISEFSHPRLWSVQWLLGE